VSEALYRRARNRWRRYRGKLEPVMDLLEPHISAFGYEA
jgi:hypothetical protein